MATTDNSVSLVSTCFALESLLGESSQERSQRDMPGKIAYILSDFYIERNAIKDEVNKGFNLRNKIVHEGQRVSKEDITTIHVLRTYLKKLLRRELTSIYKFPSK
jgi:hypothetical protein